MWLEFLRDRETSKPVNKIDTEKINKYTDELLVLQGKKITMTPEEVAERVANIPFK